MSQQIPHQIRADYVAYLRITLAIESLERIPTTAKRPPGADDAVQTLSRWRDGLYKRVRDFVESTDAAEDKDA